MAGASLAFALMAVCVKLASETLPVLEVVFFRSFMGMLMISLLMLHKGVPFWGKEQAKLILRGLSGFVALTLHFITIAHLPLGMAVILNYTAPIYVATLSVLFLQEKPGFFLWAMIFLSFAGVYLLTNPGTGQRFPASPGDLFYVVLGLLSGLAAAVAYTAIRAIRHRESPLT